MAREKITPEMDKLVKSMIERVRQIENDAKRLLNAQEPNELNSLRSRIEEGRTWLEEAGALLRAMKKDL